MTKNEINERIRGIYVAAADEIQALICREDVYVYENESDYLLEPSSDLDGCTCLEVLAQKPGLPPKFEFFICDREDRKKGEIDRAERQMRRHMEILEINKKSVANEENAIKHWKGVLDRLGAGDNAGAGEN